MRIACVGYREWALNIYDYLAQNTNHTFLICRSKLQYSDEVIKDFKPDLILFYGWSWKVADEIVNTYRCLMLHPSPLPKYRGGSPIQNQIIAGEKKSKVSVFIMDGKIDSGPLLGQRDLSLEGSLNDIFSQIEDAGIAITLSLLSNFVSPIEQDHSKATYCKRRDSSDSELTIKELSEKSAEYIINKIRMLADPYPNAYIKTVDGKKIFIIQARVEGK
jgi:methionyl-tRNA formyltransferase